MKRYLTLLSLALVLMMTAMVTSCGKPTTPTWADGRAVPFGGYVYGEEGTTEFLQLPVFFEGDASGLSDGDIAGLCLVGTKTNLECDPAGMTDMIYDADRNCSLTTLRFRVKLSTAGQYQVNQLKLFLHGNKEISFDLGELLFVVDTASEQEQVLAVKQFWANQGDFNSIVVTYENHSKQEVEILGLGFPGLTGVEIDVEKYLDTGLTLPEEGTYIPPEETRTFVFRLYMNEVDYLDPKGFAFLQPNLSYQCDGQVLTMPVQPQPLVVQPPFTDDFVSALLNE